MIVQAESLRNLVICFAGAYLAAETGWLKAVALYQCYRRHYQEEVAYSEGDNVGMFSAE